MTTALSEPRNRLVQVIRSSTINGIDFVELRSVDATTLYVHFLNAVTVQPVLPLQLVAIITGGDRIQNIVVNAIDPVNDWSVDADGRQLLTLTTNRAGDFSNYTLTLTNGVLDPLYASVSFSFKVLCPSDFDCETNSICCSVEEPPLPAIDYTAKDFQSFKLALSDFSSQRYPSWQERSEADLGVMFMEALSMLGDELSYLQDRVAGEASLLTATQKRSFVSMGRLVDYEPSPSFSASTIVQCNVVQNTIPAGTLVSATTPDGLNIPFEIGNGLADTQSFTVSPGWNDGIQPYWLDDSQQCLSCGSTSMWISGHDFNFGPQIAAGSMPLLIQTDLPGESIRQIVNLTSATELFDPIYLVDGAPAPITQITWNLADKLTRDRDLSQTHLAGNLLPVTQGQRFTESFTVGTAPAGSSMQAAITRYGPDGTAAQPNWIIRYPLSRSGATLGRLTWLPATAVGGSFTDPDIADPQPELFVTRRLPESQPFSFATTLLDATSEEAAYTVDPVAWRPVAFDNMGNITQWETDGDQGDTLRFGDGTFGLQPNEGEVYDVAYRTGLGAAGNVAAGAIQNLGANAIACMSSVRNPFVVTNGSDAESSQHIQRMAPQAFRAVQYRAVQPGDYEAAAETQAWVLKAGTAFRWTGSWLSVFTSADPLANGTSGASATEAQQTALIELLDRRRLAGYESFAPPPTLISIDLVITVCIATGQLASDVEAAVLTRLADAKQPDGTEGFFYADSFTFGTPLYRSALEAAMQGVAGVNGVLDIQYRRRGASNVFQTLPPALEFGNGELLRVVNDPSYPERGTIRVIAEGGR